MDNSHTRTRRRQHRCTMLVWRYIPTFVWLVAFFGPCGMSLRMVVHYTNAILYLMPFIGAWDLPPPVERCIPALVVYLYPAMFGIAQGKGRLHQAACRRW